MSDDARPIILLAFANDHIGGGYLRNLKAEHQAITDALERSPYRPHFEVVVSFFADVESLFDLFSKYQDRLALFHYGGHARGDALMLEGPDGSTVAAAAALLARRLHMLPALRLVFLNGCSTRDHVQHLQSGFPVTVIATERAILDEVATGFARRFYFDLGQGLTVAQAYRSAELEVRTVASDPDAVTRHSPDEHASLHITQALLAVTPQRARTLRMLRPRVTDEVGGWPWRLHAHPDAPGGEDWRLGAEERRVGPWLAVLLVALIALGTAFLWASWPKPDPASDVGPADARARDAEPPPAVDARPPTPAEAGTPNPWAVIARAGDVPVPLDRVDGWALLQADPPTEMAPRRVANTRLTVVEAVLADRLTPPDGPPIERFGLMLGAVERARVHLDDGARPDAIRDRIRARIQRSLPPAPPAGDRVTVRARPVAVLTTAGQLEVDVPTFDIATTQVTGAMIGAVLDPTRQTAPGPARSISADTARALAIWLGGRLPTEAEWQAARDTCRSDTRQDRRVCDRLRGFADGTLEWVVEQADPPTGRLVGRDSRRRVTHVDDGRIASFGLRLAFAATPPPPVPAPAPTPIVRPPPKPTGPSIATLRDRLQSALAGCDCRRAGAAVGELTKRGALPTELSTDYRFSCLMAGPRSCK